ncbi:transglutaminase-like cysteine peptidase [Devosia sp. PTR5]|uniref:Transglutaminase-like cysteine peptidase n=1 Tax=Devosia oryzisoli TaxID=2774138 RepID=A0A927FVA2_9HYPH|nr:transglutaminase-like cysteine peptidase [Devosia oryzisoli]MBD8066980.1 transglutaminase-like cysteine peptidase [Devosia oryzisoli]
MMQEIVNKSVGTLAHGSLWNMAMPDHALKVSLAAALAALMFSTTPTTSFAASAAPLGFQLFCLQQPAQCQGGGKSKVTLTSQMLESIRRVNSQINRSIRPRNDPGPDVWTLGATSGDCEDYVLSKRHALMNGGLPPSALRMAHVRTREGIDHAVLIVKTDRDDLVLDNLVGDVLPMSKVSYRILAVSSADPMVWTP